MDGGRDMRHPSDITHTIVSARLGKMQRCCFSEASFVACVTAEASFLPETNLRTNHSG